MAVLCFCIGCDSSARTTVPVAQQESVDVLCTAWPLMEFVQTLAGDGLTAGLIEPESGLSWRNRRSFFPNDDQLELLPGAKLVIENGPGVPYVGWIEMTAIADDRICNSSVNFRLDDFIPVRDYQSVHSHGPGGEHSHDYMVPYCWHDPALAAKQVSAIEAALSRTWPEMASEFRQRSEGLRAELDKLAGELKSAGSIGLQNTEVVLATPDLLFLARATGLKARYELWFDAVDDPTWMDRIRTIGSAAGTKRVVLLWPGRAPDVVRQSAGPAITLLEIDMLESGESEGAFLLRFSLLVDQLRHGLSAEPAIQ